MNIDKDWVPYDYIPTMTVRKQTIKSQQTSEKQKKSGFPTKTTAILFVIKSLQLCAILLVFFTIMSLSVIIGSFHPFIDHYA